MVFLKDNCNSSIFPHAVFTKWLWQSYHQEEGFVFLPESAGLTNRKSDIVWFQGYVIKGKQLLPVSLAFFFLPWNPAIHAIRKPKQPREASCRCWANKTSWGCNQQPASLLRHENKGKKPSDDFSLQTSCVPDKAQNSSEKKRAVPTGLFLDACSSESKNMMKCFLCHKCGLLWRLDS